MASERAGTATPRASVRVHAGEEQRGSGRSSLPRPRRAKQRTARHAGYWVLYSSHDAAVPHQATTRALRRPSLRLDNVALVPASLLPFKREWQAVANGMPTGSVLLCSTTNPRQQKILEQVSAHLTRKGHRVQTLPAERISTHTERLPGYTNSRNPDGSSGQG
jgi:hypothetical protein